MPDQLTVAPPLSTIGCMKDASPQRSKARYVNFTKADYKALSAGLLAKWPRLRFVPKKFGPTYRPEDGWQPKPPDLAVPYFDDLWGGGESWIVSWLEPEGWEPVWRWYWKEKDRRKGGGYTVVNEPRLQLDWQNSIMRRSPTASDRQHWSLNDGRVYAFYLAFDDEYASLVSRVCRLIEKYATNQAVFVRWLRHEERFWKPHRQSTMWVGHEALRWLAESPLHTLDGSFRLYTPELVKWMETVRPKSA
jgi:hypothetical protein